MTIPAAYRLPLVVALCALAYAPTLRLPLISDDWLQIALAREYGSMSGWPALALDPLYRCRATSLILVSWIDRLFGVSAFAYNAASLALHIAASLLVLAAGSWRRIGWRVSAPAAAFFAIHEAHQEAVMWSSALPDLLAFLFVAASFLAFAQWTETSRRAWLVASYAAFALALLSKESAAVAPALLLIPAFAAGIPARRFWVLAPAFALSAVYAWLSVSGAAANQHYTDGTFSFSAPFAWTMLNSFVRLLWIWGLVAAGVLVFARRSGAMVLFASAWALAGLLPYSFLTYMDRVPSRHLYLASAGLAIVVGAAFAALDHRRLALTLATLAILHNCGYLWFRKFGQFAARAEPTEQLIDRVRRTSGPVWVRCFPFNDGIAVHAVAIATGASDRLRFGSEPPEGPFEEFCVRGRV